MTKEIEAVYENGVLRPVEPLELAEGERFHLIIVTHHKQQPASDGAVKALSEIAALPIEGASDAFSGREHDRILYPPK